MNQVQSNFNALPRLPSQKDSILIFEHTEKVGIMKFIKNMFRKHRLEDKNMQIVVEPYNPELIYRLSCDKLRYRSSLLDQTLIANSLHNHFGYINPRVVKKSLKKRRDQAKSLRISTSDQSSNDEDTPLGMLQL